MDHKQMEAITAKTLAEGMLMNNDYTTAKNFASISQKLYPDLQGISQLCAMLDVLVSSEQKVNGQPNWYGLLGVDPTADDAEIKKQFKRLALLLHPDKNRSDRAEGAFKLVSEAKDFLLDEKHRSDYDKVTGLGPKSPAHDSSPSAPQATSSTPRWAPPAQGQWAPNNGPSWNASANPAPSFDPWARARGPTEHASNPWAPSGGPSARTRDSSWAPTGGPSTRTGDWPRPPTGAPFAPTGGSSSRTTHTSYSSRGPTAGPSFRTGDSSWASAGGPSWNSAAHTTNAINPWARSHRPTKHTSNPWHPNRDPSSTGGSSGGPTSNSSWGPTGAPSAPTSNSSWAPTGGPSANSGGSSAQTSGPSAQFTFTSWAQNPNAPCRPTPVRPRTDNLWTTCQRCRVQFELPRIFRNVVIVCANCCRAFLAVEVSPPTNMRPCPKVQQSDYLRFAEVTERKLKTPFENAPDKWGPLFGTAARFDGGSPYTTTTATADEEKTGPPYTEDDVVAEFEGFFKRQRMNDDGMGQGDGFVFGPSGDGFTGLV